MAILLKTEKQVFLKADKSTIKECVLFFKRECIF
jgi:hypothetical protein